MLKKLLKKILPLPANKQRELEACLASEILENRKDIDSLKELLKQNIDALSECRSLCLEAVRNSGESVWANRFHDTIVQSTWLNDKSFWPGRGALGYQAMYVSYRILNEIKPKKILELGMGQSTKLISQYVMANSDVHHTVVENNPDWISFFQKSYNIPESTNIVRLDWKMIEPEFLMAFLRNLKIRNLISY